MSTIQRKFTLNTLITGFALSISPLCSATITTQGTNPIPVGNDTVEFRGVEYDSPTVAQSTWYYTMTSGVQPAISHVTWTANLDCLSVKDAGTWDGTNAASLSSGSGIPVIGTDATTGITGVKFDQGFGDNEVRHYYFTIDGNYDESQILFASKAGSGYDTAQVIGPSILCSGSVNSPPTAVDDNVSGAYNTSINIDVLANDSDQDGDSLSNLTIIEQPSNGTVSVNPDGTITYTPNTDYCGTDSFVYEISDSEFTDQAEIIITIDCPVNQPPTANDDMYDATEDTQLLVDSSEGLIANDTDPDNDVLTVTEILTEPSNGSLTVNPDSSFSYTPGENFCGTDSFDYEISDGKGGTDQAVVTLNVACVNDPPTAVDDNSTTQENAFVDINVISNDFDHPAENDPIYIYSHDTSSQFGGSVTNNGDGSLSYTPPTGFAGVDTFSYVICDDPTSQSGLTGADSLCDITIVTISVAAKYNRSIQVDLIDFMLTGTNLSGDFTVKNVSGDGKLAQVDEFKITAEYRDGNKWKPVNVDDCTFNPDSPDTLADTEMKTYSFSCQTSVNVSSYTVRVIANIHLFGRIRGSHSDGWYWERHSK